MTPSPSPAVPHDAFEWWAQIWLPGLLGVSTFAVAVVSVVLALRAFRHESERHRQEDARRGAQKRFEFGQQLHALLDVMSDDFLSGTTTATKTGLSLSPVAQHLDEPGAPELLRWVIDSHDGFERYGDKRDIRSASTANSIARGRINAWVAQPTADIESLATPFETLTLNILDRELNTFDPATGEVTDLWSVLMNAGVFVKDR